MVNGRVGGQQLQGLTQVELAVLGVGIERIELFHGLIGRKLGHRKLMRKLVNDFVGTLPMEEIGGAAEVIELTYADLHGVAVAIDVAGFARIVE